MKSSQVFKIAMAGIGDKAVAFVPKNNAEIKEYLNLLISRASSPKRKGNLEQLLSAILAKDADKVLEIVKQYNTHTSVWAGTKMVSQTDSIVRTRKPYFYIKDDKS